MVSSRAASTGTAPSTNWVKSRLQSVSHHSATLTSTALFFDCHSTNGWTTPKGKPVTSGPKRSFPSST